MKIYYKKKTGYLCGRYPYDLPIEEGDPFIEASDDEYADSLACEWGKRWAVKDEKLTQIEDTEATSSEEWKQEKKEEEISSLKSYLTSTDYVVSKLQELSLTDPDGFEEAKKEYAETLKKRKEAREKISELAAS